MIIADEIFEFESIEEIKSLTEEAVNGLRVPTSIINQLRNYLVSADKLNDWLIHNGYGIEGENCLSKVWWIISQLGRSDNAAQEGLVDGKA